MFEPADIMQVDLLQFEEVVPLAVSGDDEMSSTHFAFIYKSDATATEIAQALTAFIDRHSQGKGELLIADIGLFFECYGDQEDAMKTLVDCGDIESFNKKHKAEMKKLLTLDGQKQLIKVNKKQSKKDAPKKSSSNSKKSKGNWCVSSSSIGYTTRSLPATEPSTCDVNNSETSELDEDGGSGGGSSEQKGRK
jgi:hypothetical protein